MVLMAHWSGYPAVLCTSQRLQPNIKASTEIDVYNCMLCTDWLKLSKFLVVWNTFHPCTSRLRSQTPSKGQSTTIFTVCGVSLSNVTILQIYRKPKVDWLPLNWEYAYPLSNDFQQTSIIFRLFIGELSIYHLCFACCLCSVACNIS